MTNPFGPNDPSFLNFDSTSPANVEVRPPRRAGTRTRAQSVPGSADLVIVPFWDGPEGDAWDRISIAGKQFAGMAAVDGQGPSLRTDRRGAPGRDGGRLVTRGYKPGEFTITLSIWTEEHLTDFEILMAEIHPLRNPNARNAVDVYHPALALLLVSQVLVTRVGPLKPSGDAGVMTCEIEATEYRAPRGRNATVTTSAEGATWDDLYSRTADPFHTLNDDPNTDAPPSATNADPT